FTVARQLVPGLRMIVVAGPRIDPAALPAADGLEVRRYVPGLYRHLAACDLAIVQGGLTTAMELTANRRPFLYFPLRHHFEQNFHVPYRLARYRAGRGGGYDASPPQGIDAPSSTEDARGGDPRRYRRGDRPGGRLPPGGHGRGGPGGGAARRDAVTRWWPGGAWGGG